MRELIKTLYEVSGSYSNKITKMLIFDVFKGVFEGVSLGAILLCLTKICENIFTNQSILMKDVWWEKLYLDIWLIKTNILLRTIWEQKIDYILVIV